MSVKGQTVLLHLAAFVIVLVWGGTFVNSKVLLLHGMRAEEIFVVRFVLAYLCLAPFAPKHLFCNSWRDELTMALLGITGGSLYFWSENQAVALSYATNVSFIVCTTPLWTTFLALLFLRNEHASKRLMAGSLMAIVGMAVVIFNGHFVLHLNPLGDMLALVAALCWAVYSLLVPKPTARYGALLLTRKLFGYGLLTIAPFFLFKPWTFTWEQMTEPAVAGNLIYLGVVASCVCFFAWSWIIRRLGVISTSNYVYLNPISTVVVSAFVLDEPMTWMAYLGSALILLGVILANKR